MKLWTNKKRRLRLKAVAKTTADVAVIDTVMAVMAEMVDKAETLRVKRRAGRTLKMRRGRSLRMRRLRSRKTLRARKLRSRRTVKTLKTTGRKIPKSRRDKISSLSKQGDKINPSREKGRINSLSRGRRTNSPKSNKMRRTLKMAVRGRISRRISPKRRTNNSPKRILTYTFWTGTCI